MATEVAMQGMSRDEILKMTGQSDPDFNNGPNIPKLSINHNAEDGNDKQIPRGSWKLYNAGRDIFSKQVVFRPYLSRYQYSVYDAQDNKFTLITNQFNSWGEACLDDNGNEYKAAKYKSSMLKSHPSLEGKLKCQRLIYGTVDMIDPTNADGEKLDTISNLPCMWAVKGKNFMIVGDVLDGLTKQNKLMLFYPMTLGSAKEKNGGNTYFVATVKVPNEEDSPKDMKLVYETMDVFNAQVKADNDKIVAVFNKKRVQPGDAFAKQVMNDFQAPLDAKPVQVIDNALNDPLDDIGT